MSVTAKALWYIESHPGGDLSLEAIGEAAGVSRFHLCRAFGDSTGQPPAIYIRARRLSRAAKSLAAGAPNILDIALEAGYGSHEAFTRAFRQHFGLTPEQLRERGDCSSISIQEPLRMHPNSTPPPAPPRTARRRAIHFVGLKRHYARGNAGIPAQWGQFAPWMGNIPGQTGHVSYGVICNCDETGGFDYIAAVEVTAGSPVPDELSGFSLPERDYVVFRHEGHISGFFNTCRLVWDKALPESGYKAAGSDWFEYYGPEFDPRTGLGGVELWIPVRIPEDLSRRSGTSAASRARSGRRSA